MKKLSRSQLKNVMGGDAPGGGSCCTHDAGWFGWNCTYNLQEAQLNAPNGGGYWCCDSCQSSWASANPGCPYLTVC